MPISNLATEYCIYLRKSRMDLEAESHGEGDTLARHRTALMELARRMELPVTQIYEEVVSGETIDGRPEVQKLLRDVEAGRWKGVLCMEVERLARGNTTDQGIIADTFKYSGTVIVTPQKTYDPSDEFDEEFFEFGLFRSRMEYRTINRRLQRGREASLKEGKYIAGAAPYGYERYKLPKEKGYSLRIIPDRAETVRQIFQWYVYGETGTDGSPSPLGADSIAKKLDSLGSPSPGGGKWPACTVRDIIANPTYIGKIRWSYRPTVKQMVQGRRVVTRPVDDSVALVDGLHEPIISPELWSQAQQILKGRTHAPIPKSTQLRNPLAGLIYCSKCGRSMVRLQTTHGRASLKCPNKDCDCMSSPVDDVESALLTSLEEWLDDYKVKLSRLPLTDPDVGDFSQREVSQLEQSLSTLYKQMDSLYDLVETGAYTHELFLQRSRVLSGKIKDTKAALDKASLQLANRQKIQQSRRDIIPRVEYVLSAYPSLETPAEQNALLKSVLEKVLYSKSQGGLWKESDMQLHIFPRLDPPPPDFSNVIPLP